MVKQTRVLVRLTILYEKTNEVRRNSLNFFQSSLKKPQSNQF